MSEGVKLPPQGKRYLTDAIRSCIRESYDIDDVVAQLNSVIQKRDFRHGWAFIEFGIHADKPRLICLQFTVAKQPGVFTFTMDNVREILAD